MALFDDIKALCDRLASDGWISVFSSHGFDLTKVNNEADLLNPLKVDRTQPGFDDFASVATRAIEPGIPAFSLLYHALASPNVDPAPRVAGKPIEPDQYPTLVELDTVENYIFSQAKKQLADFTARGPLEIAVLGYQYRTGPFSSHRSHADLVFSRTGIARVGTSELIYSESRRWFWPATKDGDPAVMPSRYGAFIVERRQSTAVNDPILRRKPVDGQLEFLFPLHKLFFGAECLRGSFISKLDFTEYHINQKLRRVHTAAADNPGFIQPIAGFNLNQPPFVRDSNNVADPLVRLSRQGAGCLVVPVNHPTLARSAEQRNAATGNLETVRFVVPPAGNVPRMHQTNRYETSLVIPAGGSGRAAPEYVNIRHQVQRSENGQTTLLDLNTLPADEFASRLASGGYEAAHFIDDSCEGVLIAQVEGLGVTPKQHHAYSLVGAPHFFPLIAQVDIQEWYENRFRAKGYFRRSEPRPLCDGRLDREYAHPSEVVPNPQLPGIPPASAAFPRAEAVSFTITAVVGMTQSAEKASPATIGLTNPTPSFLPDAGADVFAPGWDISMHGDQNGDFYAAYGLGSPFPEDAKLCAALNSFWPAAAPDAGRTFGTKLSPSLVTFGTALPLLDHELGFHPQHPRVLTGEVRSRRGWDGEFGPFFELVEGELHVNFASIARSDYVSSALQGLFRVNDLVQVNTAEMVRRMDALSASIAKIDPGADVQDTLWWLIAAEAVSDWGTRTDRIDATVTGPGYRFVFALVHSAPLPTSDPRRLRRPVVKRALCQTTRTFAVSTTLHG